MALFRGLYQKLLSHELGVLGDEIDRLEGRLRDSAFEIAKLRDRFDSHQSRVGMRMTRSARTDREDEARAALEAAGATEKAGRRPAAGGVRRFEDLPG